MMGQLDRIHDVALMMDSVKIEAQKLDIPLDYDTCMKQLNTFSEDDKEIREGFQIMYDEMKAILD